MSPQFRKLLLELPAIKLWYKWMYMKNIEGPIRKGTQTIQLTRSDRLRDGILHTTQG